MMLRTRRILTVTAAVTASVATVVVAGSPISAAAASPNEGVVSRTVWDDFGGDLNVSVGLSDPSTTWFYAVPDPSLIANDAAETLRGRKLRLQSPGMNSETGEPAFTVTAAQDFPGSSQLGVSDHAKYLLFANNYSSKPSPASPTGFVPGFDANEDEVLRFETTARAQIHGVDQQPFGDAVTNPDDDPRLGSVGLQLVDFETWIETSFLLTNDGIYALYQRFPVARPVLGDYWSFGYTIRLRDRNPGQQHRLALDYDRSAGEVAFSVDGKEAVRIGDLGSPLDPSIPDQVLRYDLGGTPTAVTPSSRRPMATTPGSTGPAKTQIKAWPG